MIDGTGHILLYSVVNIFTQKDSVKCYLADYSIIQGVVPLAHEWFEVQTLL